MRVIHNLFGKRRRLGMLCAAVALAIAIQACSQIVNIRPDFSYTLTTESKLPTRIALIIDNTSRNCVLMNRTWTGFEYQVPVGKVLEEAAVKAFQISFSDVSAIASLDDAKNKYDYALALTFGTESKLELGKTKVSSSTATIHLNCTVYEKNLAELSETRAVETRKGREAGKAFAGAVIGGVISGSISESAYESGIESAVREALEASLETIVVQIEQKLKSLAKNSEEIYQNRNQIVIEEKTEQIEHGTEAERQIDLSKQFPQEKRTKFGLKVGMNMANFSGDDVENTDSKIGLAIGGSFTFHLNDKLAIRPEFLYSTKGSKFEESISDDFTVRSTTSLNYLDIPILVVYSIQENLKLFAGPSLGIYISGKSEWEFSGDFLGVEIDDSGSEDIESDEINSPDFGLIFGASYSLGQISIGPRYSMGLANVPDIDNEDIDTKNRVIQLMVGYSF